MSYRVHIHLVSGSQLTARCLTSTIRACLSLTCMGFFAMPLMVQRAAGAFSEADRALTTKSSRVRTTRAPVAPRSTAGETAAPPLPLPLAAPALAPTVAAAVARRVACTRAWQLRCSKRSDCRARIAAPRPHNWRRCATPCLHRDHDHHHHHHHHRCGTSVFYSPVHAWRRRCCRREQPERPAQKVAQPSPPSLLGRPDVEAARLWRVALLCHVCRPQHA